MKKEVTPPCTVVAIGASAGGLTAICELLQALPDNAGVAVIVLQHLAPDHASILPSILQRSTRMPVSEVKSGEKIRTGEVYVLPPGQELKIAKGKLVLHRRVKSERHPVIDLFFSSLAEEQGEQAVGIVLSGSGSDGSRGLCAIKSAGGFTFAQDPDSAQFDAMPLSAIGSGCVDRIATPAEIASQLGAIASELPQVKRRIDLLLQLEHEQLGEYLKKIFGLLQKQCGHDFSDYKRTTIVRRLQRRMMLNYMDSFDDYVALLESSSEETEELFRDILINVTRFFRDPEAFVALKEEVLAPLVREMEPGYKLRVWVPACSTGEEVYSIAITVMETLNEIAPSVSMQIFGTDVDAEAIDLARKGVYGAAQLADIEPRYLQHYFSRVNDDYIVRKHLRERCIFAPQNVLADPPFSHIDLICCRNMLIYLNRSVQEKVLKIFHYALRQQGVLFLGSSETTGSASDLFSLLDKKHKIYRKKQAATRYYEFLPMRSKEPTPAVVGDTKIEVPESMQRKPFYDLEQMLLGKFAPPGVVINEHLDIVFFLGHAGRYLDPLVGSADLNLLSMARRELVGDLRIIIDAAMRNHEVAQRTHVLFGEEGEKRYCTIEVQPLLDNHRGRYFAVVFHEEPIQADTVSSDGAAAEAQSPASRRSAELEQELAETRQYLESVFEEHGVMQEELQAASEELQSANEELQSTNEELETAREELQSTNEELATVNEELETRNLELVQTITDLNNLLTSVNIPIVMVDEQLAIRKFTRAAGSLFNLIESDIGRPLPVIKPNIDLPELAPLVAKVIESLVPTVIEVSDYEGRSYEFRLVPYRTEDRKITGCVLILVDITAMKKDAERNSRFASVISDSGYAITVQDLQGKILTWNPQASVIYGYSEEDVIGTSADELIPAELRDEAAELRAKLLRGEVVEPLHTRRIAKSGEAISVQISAALLRVNGGEPYAIATTERLLEAKGNA